jgi:fimbrial chaperone protein
MRFPVLRSILALAACLLLGSAAGAANLQISPVSIAFQPSQAAAGVSLQNFGDAPLYGQVRVYAWDQKDGVDVLTPTSDIIASPPIIEVPANGMQTVRLVRRGGTESGPERSYRILIDEIPRGDTASGVAIRLQYSVPVFVAPSAAAAAPQLSFSLVRRDGNLVLRSENAGALHAQIGATRLQAAGGADVQISKGLLGYALAGRGREWQLPKDKPIGQIGQNGQLTVIANVNAHELSFPVAPATD